MLFSLKKREFVSHFFFFLFQFFFSFFLKKKNFSFVRMETNHIETAATAFARVKELMMGSGWIAFEHKFGADIKAEKKALPGKSVEIARAEGVVENVTPETLFNLVFNQTFEEKKKSDDSMLADEIVESINDDIRIVYQAYSAPWPVSGRDILLNRSK